MDLTFTAGEKDLVERVRAILAGAGTKDLDRDAYQALETQGLCDLAAAGDGISVLSAALVTAEASRVGALVPLGMRALVLPLFGVEARGEIVTMLPGTDGPPLVRYGADATLAIRRDGERAYLHRVDPSQARVVHTNLVYPVAELAVLGDVLADAPANTVLRRARIALAAEMTGALDSGLALLTAFLTERHQFGRPLGSFQAIHHRVAEMAIDVEAARWITRYAAWSDQDGLAATAAALAARTGRRHCFEAHQLTGARGFTLELGLSHDTLRMHYLSVELGGPAAHEADGYRALWPAAA